MDENREKSLTSSAGAVESDHTIPRKSAVLPAALVRRPR